MALAFDGTPSKKIGTLSAFEFSCAGSRENETLIPVLLNEVMDSIKKDWDSLDFIYDDCGLVSIRRHDVDKALGMRHQGTAYVRLKEIDGKRIRELMSEPYRLPCATRSEKEETTFGEAYHSLFHDAYHSIFSAKRQSRFSIVDGKNASNFPSVMEV